MILSGAVKVGGQVVTRAGQRIAPDKTLVVEGESRFVSRAGEKLEAALDAFGVKVAGRSCIDTGASTGGFTDVLLKRGASKVLAVDVGYDQLARSLRDDPRVAVMEKTNVRHLSGENLPFEPDLLVADLSFIPLAVALERLLSTTPSVREAIVLVKPQFEVGPEKLGRGGLVRDDGVHAEAIRGVAESFAALNFDAIDVMRSPVAGRRSGNREYPLYLLRDSGTRLDEARIREAVAGG